MTIPFKVIERDGEPFKIVLYGADLLAPILAAAEAARDAVKPLYGTGAPAAGLGIDGSTYIDITDPDNPILYGPKQDPGPGWGAGRPYRGPASGPLTTGSVGAGEISNDSGEQDDIRDKIGAGSAADTATGRAAAVNQPFASTSTDNLTLAPRPVMRINQAVQNAILAGVINITVVGDSIMEPAGISYADSVAENVQRMFQSKFPWLTINLTNLSIPGRSMQDLANSGYDAPGDFTLAAPTGIDTSNWPGGSVNGKTWRDHVKDSLPDVIILALGENDGTDELPYSQNYQTFYEYSQTWTKKPWFTLVSSLLPEGSDVDRQGKQAIADFVKYKSVEQGFGLIDANSFYRLLRDGVRRDLIPFTEEVDFVGFNDPTKWLSTGPTLAGTTVSGAGRFERQTLARDVDVVDYFTLTGSDAVWATNFRVRPAGAGGYAVQANFADGFTRLYYRGSLVALGAIPVKTAGQSVRIRVKAWGPLILVWHDNTLVLSYSSAQGLYAGVFDVGTATGSGSHAQFRVSFAPEYQAAASFFSASYLLNDNLHHPTSAGAFQTYIPATKQFVDEFAEVLRQPIVVSSGVATADITSTVAFADIPGASISFTLARAQTALVSFQMGYVNAVADGQVLLYVDGVQAQGWWLPLTSGTNNNPFSVTAPVDLSAGAHTIKLRWGGQDGITSNGGNNGRSIATTITVA